MQKILIIINDAPYGTEKAYNALRMAMTLQKEHADQVANKNIPAGGRGLLRAAQSNHAEWLL